MKAGIGGILLVLIVGLMACGNDNEAASPGITVKKAVRSRKKGRIYEKTIVVQVPLTAEENNLHGKVHTVSYRTYALKDGGKKLLDSGFNVYDEAGRLKEQNAWKSNGERKWRCVYSYNAKGQLAQWNLDMQARGEKDTTTFTYDATGNKIKAVTRANDPMQSGRKEYVYDRAGNEIEAIKYSMTGSMQEHILYEYDENDNQVTMAELFPDGTAYKIRKATYDGYGSITGLTLYLGDSVNSRTLMVNDARGKHIEIRSLAADSSYEGRSVYAYDSVGNMVEQKVYKASDEQALASHVLLEYEYDIQGNIAKQTAVVVQKGKRVPKEYVEYTYTYYK